ncbi:MAG: mannitol dehydrogenase family protein [Clostridia bacterium]|nr:mannitol dehydrogenase family protein [Clostridia bacterium]
MKLDSTFISSDRTEYTEKGYAVPTYDILKVRETTEKEPEWIHFGGGNIFRAYIANLADRMLEEGITDKGVITCSGFDRENIECIYRAHDNHSILVTLDGSGKMEKKIISSVTEALLLSHDSDDFMRLKEIFRSPSLKIATFTITEKGYSITDAKGDVKEEISSDILNGPENPLSYLGAVTALLYERFRTGKLRISMCSLDNCSHNGDRLKNAVKYIAEGWVKNMKCEEEFLGYILDPSYVAFPYSMIDKITPRPDPKVQAMLKGDGFTDMDILVTEKKTYLAPFTNAEKPEYLVIEESFPNGRPDFHKVGVYVTDRDTVLKAERMKVTTCLNPLHTALAVYGCLLGYTKISQEMLDPVLKTLVYRLGYTEGLPVVTDPGIISPEDFIKEVLEERIPNPFLPDTPQRIAMDTSQKLPVRFGETIKEYMRRGMDLDNLICIPLVFSGWLRYLVSLDDSLEPFEVSADPFYNELAEKLKGIVPGETDRNKVENAVKDILRDDRIFGVDLYEAGLAEKVIDLLLEELKGKNAVYRTLSKYMTDTEHI